MTLKLILGLALFFVIFWFGYAAGKDPLKAKWKQMEFWPNGGTWRCTNCARQIMFKESNPNREHMFYCPECGAKMEVELE